MCEKAKQLLARSVTNPLVSALVQCSDDVRALTVRLVGEIEGDLWRERLSCNKFAFNTGGLSAEMSHVCARDIPLPIGTSLSLG